MYVIKDNEYYENMSESLKELICPVLTETMVAERLNEIAWIKHKSTSVFLPFVGDFEVGELTVACAKQRGTYTELFDRVIDDIIFEIEDTFKHATEVSMCYGKFTITKE